MVRAPCCEKMGMKRGPWTAEEDQVLINFISFYGHGNWRALPKQAGLLRCGKSCRLRWNNYLRPDIKRGNFTSEEEDTIVNLHKLLGNRWSAIAARLPGRTDNEIKNVWHTHLKKRLVNKEQDISSSDTISVADDKPQPLTSTSTKTSRDRYSAITCHRLPPPCPQPSSSTEDISSSVSNNENILVGSSINNNEFLEIDENFWSEAALSVRNKPSCTVSEFPLSSFFSYGNIQGEPSTGLVHGGDHNGMDFWYEMFNGSGESLLFEG